MSKDFNTVTLSGRLGKDPEIRTTQGGSKIASFSIANSESWTDRTSGERKEVTHWHRIVIANDGMTKTAEMFLQKGSKVGIVGRLENRRWTDDTGRENTVTEIIVRSGSGQLILMDNRPASAPADDNQP